MMYTIQSVQCDIQWCILFQVYSAKYNDVCYTTFTVQNSKIQANMSGGGLSRVNELHNVQWYILYQAYSVTYNDVYYTKWTVRHTMLYTIQSVQCDLQWCILYKVQHTVEANMSGGDLSQVNELSSEIDLDKQIVLKKHSRHVTLSSKTFFYILLTE